MNKYLKQRIKEVLEVPAPDQQEKAKFLRTLAIPRISMWQFVLIQITI